MRHSKMNKRQVMMAQVSKAPFLINSNPDFLFLPGASSLLLILSHDVMYLCHRQLKRGLIRTFSLRLSWVFFYIC